MVALADLWLPIVLSAVGVFFVSSILHMCLPVHKGDFKKLQGEDKILELMRAQGVNPGGYMFPCSGSMKEMQSPEMQAKLKLGPVGHMTIINYGPLMMGKSLLQWFILCLAIGTIVAILAGTCHSAGTNPNAVFHTTFLAALLGHALSHASDSIWKGVSWKITAKFFIDGVLYALTTAGIFVWLWPAAVA